jgi:hypothetical protein
VSHQCLAFPSVFNKHFMALGSCLLPHITGWQFLDLPWGDG